MNGKLVWRDALAFADGLEELAGQFNTLTVMHLQANNLATEQIHEQVKVAVDTVLSR